MKELNTQTASWPGNFVFNIYNAFGKIFPDKGWGIKKLLTYETKILWKCMSKVEKIFPAGDGYGLCFGTYYLFEDFYLIITNSYFNLLKLKEAYENGILSTDQLQYELITTITPLRNLYSQLYSLRNFDEAMNYEKAKLTTLHMFYCLDTVDVINRAIIDVIKIDTQRANYKMATV